MYLGAQIATSWIFLTQLKIVSKYLDHKGYVSEYFEKPSVSDLRPLPDNSYQFWPVRLFFRPSLQKFPGIGSLVFSET